jgi:hypothetical protein
MRDTGMRRACKRKNIACKENIGRRQVVASVVYVQ